MNIHRRKILFGAGALAANSVPILARANARSPLLVYITDDSPAGVAQFEETRVTLVRRLGELGVNLAMAHVPSKIDQSAETRLKLRRALENLKPTIILASHDGHAEDARELRLGLPILFFFVGNPIARGFTNSLNRPTGGMTGYVQGPSSLVKRRELLFRLLPQCRNLGVFDLEFDPAMARYNDSIIQNDPFTKVKRHFFYCSTPAEFEKFSRGSMVRSVDAWDIPWVLFVAQYKQGIVDGFSRLRIPAMYSRISMVKLGGMAALQTDSSDMVDVFARQIFALLNGVPIENIPIVQSTRYKFGLNLAALQNAGIRPPKSLIKAADVVIQ